MMIIGIGPDGSLFPIEKLEAHYRNIRHKAVSVFVFGDGELLLQRRAADKYHSGLLWTNTCCSHPVWNETAAQCAHRRLREEMGLNLMLRELGTVNYAADVGGGMFENEEAHLFVGHLPSRPGTVAFDPDEVCEIAWMDVATLEKRVVAEPGHFTAWLPLYLQASGSSLRNEAGSAFSARQSS